MRLRWLAGLVAALLVALPVAARAGEKASADEPTVVVRVQSLDTVLRNVKLLVSLAGREEAAEQIEALVKAKVGAKGLEGIDPKRPVGAYLRFGKELEEISGAVLIPIQDEKAFLGLLENLNLQATKGKDDIYTVQTNKNFDLYLRFANKYAYVSAINTENLKGKNLLDPAKVLAGKATSAISASVRLDQIPDAAKFLALAGLEENLQKEIDKAQPKPETETEKALRVAVIRQMGTAVSDVIKEGQRLAFDVGINEQTRDFSIEMSLSATPGTALAKAVQNVGQTQSLFGGFLKKDAAFEGLAHVILPEPVQKNLAKAIDEGVQKSLADIQDAAKKQQAKQLIDALMPSLRQGELDAYFGMTGPVGKHFTLLGAVKLKDGDKLGATVRDLITDAMKTMPEAEKAKIHLDAEKVGDVTVHRFEVPKDPKTQKVLDDLPGDNNLYVAFRKDALFLAIGKESLPTLKQALGASTTAASPVFVFDFDVARIAPVLAKTQEQRDLATKLFKGGQDGTIRLTVTGGAAVSARLSMKLNALEFFAKTNEGKGQ